jgi:predicted ATPase
LYQNRASCQPDEVQFYDRSPVCKAALSIHLGYPFSAALSRELERIKAEAIYERHLGFIKPGDARRISFDQALRFERIHEETYQSLGFDLISVKPGNLD